MTNLARDVSPREAPRNIKLEGDDARQSLSSTRVGLSSLLSFPERGHEGVEDVML